MKKSIFFLACAISALNCLISCKQLPQQGNVTRNSEHEEYYDNPRSRDSLEFEKLKDPALGYIPFQKLARAVTYTENQKRVGRLNKVAALSWIERGPISDTVGKSNGNKRSADNTPATSGYITAILIDTLNDATGNTVFCAGTSGGLWKCTNFLSSVPNWTKINDHNETLSIAYICQDPTDANIMYYSTGDAPYSTLVNFGDGIWKSTDAGTTWTKLASTSNFIKSFKIVCDASGNVYMAAKATTTYISQPYGLFRSKDHGTSWENITPANLTSDSSCTDIEISSTGRLHASFGWDKTKVNYWYTDDPANVTTTIGWNSNTSIHTGGSSPSTQRMELACQGDILYAVTSNSSGNADSCYKSTDGGTNWTLQNSTAYPTGILNNQGYYDITLAINPDNPNEFMVGGLEMYKSTNSGQTCTSRMTYWLYQNSTDAPYVHADHHFMQWWKVGSESRVVIGCDGGIFLSRDGGVTFQNRNIGLGIKQFYSCAIHPDAGSPYLLAGAQDNGTHSLQNAGLSGSTEVTGGDGAFVHINQKNPSLQYGAYIFNNYRRSRDGGHTWEYISISNGGLFTNPFDVDDGQNILYGSYITNGMLRWPNADSGIAIASFLTINQLNGKASAFKVSPYTKDRLFIGSTTGKLLRLDNASTVSNGTMGSNVTDITGAGFPTAFLNCVNTGSSDQFLVAVFSNFGINNVWYSNNAGASWSAIDGNLPDMPVRWAVFDPQHDDQLYIATGAGVYHTDAINGSSTVWTPEPGLPTVRTDMLQVRLSDNTMVAGTYGRGLFTAVIPATPELRFNTPFATYTESTAATTGCKNYKDYQVNISMIAPPAGDATATYSITAGNTAIEGIDFDFTTNGSFSSPSKQQVFTNGTAQTKFITIRIYDDKEVEATETFTIEGDLSGVTNATTGNHNTFKVTIISNDNTPLHLVSSSTTVGTASTSIGNTSSGPLFNAKLKSNSSEMLYTAAELLAAGVTAGKITSISFNLDKHSNRAYTNFKIGMGLTSLSYLVDNGTLWDVDMVIAKSLNSYNTVNGWNTFALDAPFEWDGISNIAIEICYNNVTTDNSDASDVPAGYSDPNAAQTQGNFYYQNNIDCSQSFSSVFYYFFGVKPELQVGFSNNGSIVETTLNASKTEYLGPNSDVNFYSAQGVLMGRIQNLSNFDYGCTQLIVDRAGNGTSPFWDNNPSDYLLNKTYHVIPAQNNPSGTYQITLYYSQAEVDGWQTATGQTWNNIQLVKTTGQINQVTPSDPNAAGNIMVVNPVLGTFGPDYSISYTFSNGFSGFGAGVPGLGPLPVTLVNFRGRLDHAASVLEWSTSFEQNAKNFEIERSSNGINFNKIGTVAAIGNSSVQRNYAFTDNYLNPVNFYRLRMNDQDGRYKMSNVVLIKYSNNYQNMQVLNNPFRNSINFSLAKQATKVHLELITASGSIIFKKDLDNTGTRNEISLPSISNGPYVLRAVIDGEVYTFRLIRQ